MCLIVEKDAFVMDDCLWLITEVYDNSQKHQKLLTNNCQDIS